MQNGLPKTTSAAKYAKWSPKNHFYQILALQPGENSYPIVAATFILLPKEKSEMNKEVVRFFDFAFKKGDEDARKLGYIPLPAETKALVENRSFLRKDSIN